MQSFCPMGQKEKHILSTEYSATEFQAGCDYM